MPTLAAGGDSAHYPTIRRRYSKPPDAKVSPDAAPRERESHEIGESLKSRLETMQGVIALLEEARVEAERARAEAAREAERRAAAIAERQAHENVMGCGAPPCVRRARRRAHVRSYICHELRNPLHAISGLAEADAAGAAGHEILEICAHMRTILDDMLDLSKVGCRVQRVRCAARVLTRCLWCQLRAGKMAVTAVDTDVRLLAQQCVRGVSAWSRADISIETDSKIPPTVCVDPQRLRQIIENGLSNAAKMSEGPITVRQRLWRAADPHDQPGGSGGREIEMYECEILDSGPGLRGVPPEVLFQEFAQGYQGATRHGVKGTGLGLSVCKMLVELMEGSIALADRADGKPGARFAFSVRTGAVAASGAGMPAMTPLSLGARPLRRPPAGPKLMSLDSGDLSLTASPGRSLDATGHPGARNPPRVSAGRALDMHCLRDEAPLVTARGSRGLDPAPGSHTMLTPSSHSTLALPRREAPDDARGAPPVLTPRAAAPADAAARAAADVGAAAAVAAGAGQRAPSPTVFVVDDEVVNRKVIVRMLERIGVTSIVTCGDGNEVARALQSSRGVVDLIMLDIMMPKARGDEVRYAAPGRRVAAPTVCAGVPRPAPHWLRGPHRRVHRQRDGDRRAPVRVGGLHEPVVEALSDARHRGAPPRRPAVVCAEGTYAVGRRGVERERKPPIVVEAGRFRFASREYGRARRRKLHERYCLSGKIFPLRRSCSSESIMAQRPSRKFPVSSITCRRSAQQRAAIEPTALARSARQEATVLAGPTSTY